MTDIRPVFQPFVGMALALLLAVSLSSAGYAAIGDAPFVSTSPSAGAVVVAQGDHLAPIVTDENDWPGVLRAAGDLQADIERVTGNRPTIASTLTPAADVVIVGTLGRSKVIDDLAAAGRIDIGDVRGKWEAFLIQTVAKPFPGVDRALIIAGSDKRGTIYGIYEVSQQIGVSPWYWWADVPVVHRDALFVAAGTRMTDAPVVRYRGIFINDEAPSFSSWAQEKFGGANHKLYARVFELILRLRGNYLWPAMWKPRAFYDDDPENGRLADEYGIVMGTSHHEPMMRAHEEWDRYGKGPWDYSKNAEVLREFWRGGVERSKDFEKIVTIGMRGDGDEAMSEETNVALLEHIVADQRAILTDVMARPAEDVPQLWALYKEVQGYYERGMRVPDDVTLLWCDDNWGNIRRLPTPVERERPGGAGVYYHFDYVGGPRNYKWINVTPITKVWEQMHLAWRYGANRIWIVNVGDLKPMEFPIEFFLNYAWNPARWDYDDLGRYSTEWAAREFGQKYAAEIARLINGYTKLNRLRTPEMLTPDTFSVIHDREAERMFASWRELVASAEAINSDLAPEFRDAFFQLVLYPVKASAVVHELYVAAARNKLYAVQGRATAQDEADRVRVLFAEDQALVDAYHNIRDGKWNHQMDQINMGYTYWQSPPIEVMPAVSDIRVNAGAEPGFAVEGDPFGRPRWGTNPAAVPSIDRLRRNTRWVDLFNRGDTAFAFTATADQPWLTITPSSGAVQKQARLELGANWAGVPADATGATVTITTDVGPEFTVHVPIADVAAAVGSPAGTFIETNGHIAIDAPHFARAVDKGGALRWKTLRDFGRGLGAVTTFPVRAAEANPGGDSPRLEYDVQFAADHEVTIEFQIAPSLDFQSGEGLGFAWSIDDAPPRVVRPNTFQSVEVWEKAVGDSVRKLSVTASVTAGHHVLKYWYVTPGVVLERILIDGGGLEPSYLGPPESARTEAQSHGEATQAPWELSPQERQRLQQLTEQDHADMMRQLGISKLRPGRNGGTTPDTPNPANYDEARANPFPDWPELLVARNGEQITRAEQWWKVRRPEIAEDFEREVVGRVPVDVPKVSWHVARTIETSVGGRPVVAREVIGHVDNSRCPEISVNLKMSVVTPAESDSPVPALVMFGWGNMPDEPAPHYPGFVEPAAPPSTEQLIAAGWGYVSLDTASIQPDNGAGLTAGIIGLTNRGQRRTPEQWGALRAWAWGASRALDYLEALPAVDAKRVGIEGVSRYGKAALVAMAFEPRFAVVLVGSSGEGGAKPHRRDFGEAVENLTGTYAYHWMAGNFLKYGAEESLYGRRDANDIPVDAHELIALCAPRPTFISYGVPEKGDARWLDQQGSFMATVAAGAAFRLLGARDLGVKEDYRVARMPPVNEGLLDGELAWRQHDGGHEDRSNMSFFITWASRLLNHPLPHRTPSADRPVSTDSP